MSENEIKARIERLNARPPADIPLPREFMPAKKPVMLIPVSLDMPQATIVSFRDSLHFQLGDRYEIFVIAGMTGNAVVLP